MDRRPATWPWTVSIVLGWLFSLPASADIWKCRDDVGRVVYKAEKCEDVGLRTIETFWREPPPPKSNPGKKKSKQTAAPVARDQEAIFRRVAASMLVIKKNLRDPDSVVWEYAGASSNGDVICIAYRARNGFGGFNREHMVVNNEGGTASLVAWNRNCAGKQLTDFTYAKHAVP